MGRAKTYLIFASLLANKLTGVKHKKQYIKHKKDNLHKKTKKHINERTKR